HEGMLSIAAPLPKKGEGFARLRDNGVNWGNPRLVAAIIAASAVVAKERPGARLIIGDLSARYGGGARGHRSHRTGRDADLLLYATTPDGRPIDAPGFVRYGPDGLGDTSLKDIEPDAPVKGKAGEPKAKPAKVMTGGKFLRFDVEREWLL